jgi:hypothetical protein
MQVAGGCEANHLKCITTGFRGSDAVKLTFCEIRFDKKEIGRVTETKKTGNDSHPYGIILRA